MTTKPEMSEHTVAAVEARIVELAPFAAAGDGSAQRDIAMLRAYAEGLRQQEKPIANGVLNQSIKGIVR